MFKGMLIEGWTGGLFEQFIWLMYIFTPEEVNSREEVFHYGINLLHVPEHSLPGLQSKMNSGIFNKMTRLTCKY